MKSKAEFKKIFQDHWGNFKNMYSAYNNDFYDSAVQKMLGCGDAENGYTDYCCVSCGEIKRIPFTCKSSFCLSCGKVRSDEVVSQVSKMLHPGVSYRHIVLTVPEQLRCLFYKSRTTKEAYAQLMRIGYKCLKAVAETAKKQSLKIGATILLHTHGRPGNYNPHIHVIMTNGGINEEEEKWVNLGYFPYEIIHKKWQYYLLSWAKEIFGKGCKKLVDQLWNEYPLGFVSHVSKGEAPSNSRGLAKYLAKYVASPPISIKRILDYTGSQVTYWYKDHKTKQRKTETVDVLTFIGRMVQHILPKGFQRIRYYGLQATKTFSKWCTVIKKGLKKIGKLVLGTYQVIGLKAYRERHKDSTGKDPLLCSRCGKGMELWRIWHPNRGLSYDTLGLGYG